jgi:catechol 2,3-dioxygenase-like lactoylglutathione lyase family enzyme
MRLSMIAVLGASLALTGPAALAAPPAALKPAHIAGPGVNVVDLEGAKAWYVDKLGMNVVRTYDRDGKPFEYVLNFNDGPDRAVLVLARSPQRPPGPNLNSRLILLAPDAKALAAHLKTVGVEPREVVPDVAYFIRDPEGNPIELYTPPKP